MNPTRQTRVPFGIPRRCRVLRITKTVPEPPKTDHDFVLRQHFFVPKASGYEGSVLDIRNYASFAGYWLNATSQEDSPNYQYGARGPIALADQQPIGPLLHAGDNWLVLGMQARSDTKTAGGRLCNATSFLITIRAHNATEPIPATGVAHASGVTPVYPTVATALPRSAPVAFVWKPYMKAANYILQIWLARQTGNAPLSAGAQVTFSMLVSGRTSYSRNADGFVAGLYHYDLVPLDARGTALAEPGNPTTFTLTP